MSTHTQLYTFYVQNYNTAVCIMLLAQIPFFPTAPLNCYLSFTFYLLPFHIINNKLLLFSAFSSL